MLIRFAVSNFLSIRDQQELSLVASSLKDVQSETIEVRGLREQLLPAVAIYGANASGKTNLLYAFSRMRSFILGSHKDASPTATISRQPFLLDPSFQKEPSRYDCDFLVDGVRYHYGFTANDESFLEEWLYAYPSGQRQTWFYRGKDTKDIHFGKNLRGKNKSIALLTRANSLFLSAAAQNAHEQLSPIYNYFQNHFRILLNPVTDANAVGALYGGLSVDDRIIKFLATADTGISSARLSKVDAPDEGATMWTELRSVVTRYLPADAGTAIPETLADVQRLDLGHIGADGKPVFIPVNLESRGTLRLLHLLKPMLEAIDKGTT